MKSIFIFALVVVLACFVASAVSQSSTQVSDGQKVPVPVPFPRSIANMTGLELLKMGSFFSGTVIDLNLGNLKALKTLTLEANTISSPFPSSWSGMDSLESFIWVYDRTTNVYAFPSFLEGMTALKKIQIISAQISGTIPSFVASLPSLTSLSLSSIGNLIGPLPDSISNSTSLENIDLSSLPSFDQGTSNSMPSDWSQATALKRMLLYNTPIEGSLPSRMPPNLEHFRAETTRLSGVIPQSLVNTPTLMTLSIVDSPISGHVPAPTDLENSKLTAYRVDSTQVTSVDENVLRIPNLLTLSLGYNKIRGMLPPKMGFNDSSLLTHLDVRGNEFVGPIPCSYFSNAPNLISLYASYNKLSGELPSSIVQAKKLQTLCVDHNSSLDRSQAMKSGLK